MTSGVEIYRLHRYLECLTKCKEQGVAENECVKICTETVFGK